MNVNWKSRDLVCARKWNLHQVETKPPHLFQKFIHDKPALQEVAYQTLVHGVVVALAKDRKLT
jgi:hypothetical protein